MTSETRPANTNDPGFQHMAITKSNTVDIVDSSGATRLARGVWVGTGGDVVLVDIDNRAETYPAIPDNTLLPFRARRVNSTGTTASNMKAWF